MRKVRGILGIVLTGLVMTAFMSGPAQADTPENFVGNAAGRALAIKLLGQDLTFGVSSANVTAPLSGLAKAAGQILPSVVASQQSSANTNGANDTKPEVCGPISLPSQLSSIISLDTACSSTVAKVLDGLVSASSVGKVASLDLSANTVLSQLPIQSTLAQILTPITSAAQGTPLDPVLTTVGQLTDSVLKTKTLEVTLGKSTSDVLSTVNSITSTGTADGADIKILPTPEILKQVGGNLVPDLAPVIEIKVSSSKATATYNRDTGVATPSFDAALVTINLNPTLAAALGLPASTSIKPGVTQTLLAGTPLQSTIVVADGSTSKAADGTVSAIADGVSVKLLQGLNASSATAYDGGLVLNLAHSEANVVGVPATKVLPQVVVKPPTLPRTGGTPWIPMVGAGLLGVALISRRLLVARG
ncbi:MAG: hypothetical protein JOZ37_04890 [Actinobacteria bacterium]|nr:hypothetical protein [Actinomycetota bacterium]MBV8959955.1 hypothetical protein [Actinomycetota bacterium]MBV9255815.1 hypothetical protein [Actinomycetota bacterium]MBV9663280.1 hypothetical protein [Actinomycetota bacterium]MBV9933634.1 hypothetical protein [Actinomycetota bacterium]